MAKNTRLVIAMAAGVAAVPLFVRGDGFTDPSNWVTYDFPGDNSTDGFGGAAYDSNHGCIYFAPWIGSATITRYCKTGSFDDPTSWGSCDVGNLIGALGGYNGVAFDGRYVYFAPYTTPSDDYHGEVLRHDTNLSFCDAASWATFDAIANAEQISGADRPGGFAGAILADGYIYFSPSRRYNNGLPNGIANGEVLRYNTNCGFSDPACWEAFDFSKSPSCVTDPDCHARGYGEPCFDGRYVYFSPNGRDGEFHGEVMRYDSAGRFSDETSWVTFDFGDHCTPGVDCTDPDGYTGCAVDRNGIVYFAQENNHSLDRGEILRYDSREPFTDPASWAIYDTSNNAPFSKGGYEGVVFDGVRYMYFVPTASAPSWDSVHAEVLRLDTHASFDQPEAWAIYDYGDDPDGCASQGQRVGTPCADPDGYHNAVFDGRYIYFSPSFNGTTMHGEVLRYETSNPEAGCILYDEFSGDLSQWDTWNGGGNYTIQITGSQGVPAPSLLIDDYLNWGAAVFSKQTFAYSNGLEISADQKSDAAWQDQRYTLMGLWRGGPETSLMRSLVSLSINDNGNTIDCRVLYDACGEDRTEYYWHPFPNTGQWSYGRIVIRPDGYVEFYVGPDSASDPDHSELQHIYTSAHPITMAYDGQATIKLGNRRNLYDNVCVRIPAPSEGGPVAYWSFDDSSDPGHDDSGNGHHGTVFGATWANGALWFDGVDDQVTVASAPDLELSGPITVAAWVHPTGVPPARSFGTHSHILSKSNSDYYGGGRNYELDYTRDPSISGSGWFNASGGTVGGVYTEDSHPTGAWYHLAGVYDPIAQENRIYIDGERSASRSTVGQVPTIPNNAPVVIGYGEVAAHFFHFEGAIDEVYIYDRVLFDDEIRSLAVARGTSPVPDCNDNGIPDECEPDSDGDGVIDDCDDATCGNGLVELPEECDDGNIISGDGCASGCSIEPDYTCSGEPSVCQPANQSPVCDGGGPYEAECDGSTATIQLESRSTDPDPGDTLMHAWSTDCAGGTLDDPRSHDLTLTLISTAVCEQSCNVDLTVTDDDGASATCSTTVTVHDTNLPSVDCPLVSATECISPEGAPVTFDVARWDLCDSQPQVECVDAAGYPIASGAVLPIGSTVVTCTAEDACGLTSLPCSFTVDVNSTPPVITSLNGSPLLLPVGDAVTFVVEFDDNPGDVHSAVWDFGDGQLTTGDAENPLSTAHTYDLPGIYTASITILDRCGNEATDTLVVVVYDPAAGFTTGGGWFVPDSDSFIDGAPVTDTASKANFGFVVKYKQGADNPDGNLEFVYKAGDINLNSTDMDWLVVQSTTKVRFKGLATINRSQDLYTFKVTAEDKGEPGTNDTFQIEIWTGVVDTENGPPTPKHKAKGVLGGGNVKIHQ